MLTVSEALELLETTRSNSIQEGMILSSPDLFEMAEGYLKRKNKDHKLYDLDANVLSRFLLRGFRADDCQNDARLQAGFFIFKGFFELGEDEAYFIFEYLGQQLLKMKGFTPTEFVALCRVAKAGHLLFLADFFSILQELDFSESELLKLIRDYGKNPIILALHYQLYDSLRNYAPETRYLDRIGGYPTVVTKHETLLTRPVMKALIRFFRVDALTVLQELIDIFGGARFLDEEFLHDLLAIESVNGMRSLQAALNRVEHSFSHQDCLIMVRFVAQHASDVSLLQAFTEYQSNVFFGFLLHGNSVQAETFLICLRNFCGLEALSGQKVFNQLLHLFSSPCAPYADCQYLPDIIENMMSAGFREPDDLFDFLARWASENNQPALRLKNIFQLLSNARDCFDKSVIQRIPEQNAIQVFRYIELLKKCNRLNTKDYLLYGLNLNANAFQTGIEYLSILIQLAPNLFDYLNEGEAFELTGQLFNDQKQAKSAGFYKSLTLLSEIVTQINFENRAERSDVSLTEQINFFHRQLVKLIFKNTDWVEIHRALHRLNRHSIFSVNNFCQIFACLTEPKNTLAHQAIHWLEDANLLTEEYFFAFYEFLFRNDCLEKNSAALLKPLSSTWIKTWRRLQMEPNLNALIRSFMTQNKVDDLRNLISCGLITPEQLRYEINLYLDDYIIQGNCKPPEVLESYPEDLIVLYIQICLRETENHLIEAALEIPKTHGVCQQFIHWIEPIQRFWPNGSEKIQPVLYEAVFDIATQILDCSERIKGFSVGADEGLRCHVLRLLQYASYFPNPFKGMDEGVQEKRLHDIMAEDSEEAIIVLQQQLISDFVLQRPWMKGESFKTLLEASAEHRQRFEGLVFALVETELQPEEFFLPAQKESILKAAHNRFTLFGSALSVSSDTPLFLPVFPPMTQRGSFNPVD